MMGQSEVVVAGGMESMSNAPLALKKARWGHSSDDEWREGERDGT